MTIPLELRTRRLRFVRVTAEHIDDLVALDSDPEVMRYINGGQPHSREDYAHELLPRMTAHDDQPYGFLCAYDGERFVGWFHLRPSIADASILELGYRLHRNVWGQGLATEGGKALIHYAFEQLDQPAVDACADPRNEASIRVMVKCGMQRVGTLIHPRAPIQVVRYLIKRPRPAHGAREFET